MNIHVVNSKIFKDLMPNLGEILKGNSTDIGSPDGATVRFKKMRPGEPMDWDKDYSLEVIILFQDKSRNFHLKFWCYNMLANKEAQWSAHSGSGTTQDYADILSTLKKIESIIIDNIQKLKTKPLV